MENAAAPEPSSFTPDGRLAARRAALEVARTADECVGIAQEAEGAADAELHRRALARAIALDRDCQAALIEMAAEAKAEGDVGGMFAFVEEAARARVLPDELAGLREELFQAVRVEASLANYLRAIGRTGRGQAEEPLSVVLITNLFPPQELGGYGRMMWEFAHGLLARGHRVRVLTSDVTEFGHQGPTCCGRSSCSVAGRAARACR
jgi:hypothetical protein